MDFKKIIDLLISRNETIATMESCTGGGVANAITNIPNASNVLKFSAVTYSNEYKIKMGVSSDVIDKYGVYSIETAHEMARNISLFANSSFGVGVTGKLNEDGNDLNDVYISIYYKDNYYDITLHLPFDKRSNNKNVIINSIINKLEEILLNV